MGLPQNRDSASLGTLKVLIHGRAASVSATTRAGAVAGTVQGSTAGKLFVERQRSASGQIEDGYGADQIAGATTRARIIVITVEHDLNGVATWRYRFERIGKRLDVRIEIEGLVGRQRSNLLRLQR